MMDPGDECDGGQNVHMAEPAWRLRRHELAPFPQDSSHRRSIDGL